MASPFLQLDTPTQGTTLELLTVYLHGLYCLETVEELRLDSIRMGWDILERERPIINFLNTYLFQGDCTHYTYFLQPREMRIWYWGAINTLAGKLRYKLDKLEGKLAAGKDRNWLPCVEGAVHSVRSVHSDLSQGTINRLVQMLQRVVGPPLPPSQSQDHVVPSDPPISEPPDQ